MNFNAIKLKHHLGNISSISKDILNNKKTSLTCNDIILGNTYKIHHILFNSCIPGLNNVYNLLSQSQNYLNEMNNVIQELYNIFINASTNTLSDDDLQNLEVLFQNQIQYLDLIAATSKYNSITPLNGSLSSETPLILNTPTGDINITIPSMLNSISPIGNPGPNGLRMNLPTNINDLMTAILHDDDDNPIDVLNSLKEFCGIESFIYIITNQINNAFTEGLKNPNNEYLTCLEYLQNPNTTNWNTLLKEYDAINAVNLINTPAFATNIPNNTLETSITAISLGSSQDQALFATITTILEREYIPLKYLTKVSSNLSIASPDYFSTVEVRIKSTIDYISDAQVSINNQLKFLENIRLTYFEHIDSAQDISDFYLQPNIIEESEKLSQMMNSSEIFMSIYYSLINFKNTISETAIKLLRI